MSHSVILNRKILVTFRFRRERRRFFFYFILRFPYLLFFFCARALFVKHGSGVYIYVRIFDGRENMGGLQRGAERKVFGYEM